MKELFRATVMLAVLVGLPSAWIYYGPLPPSAQKAVDRVVQVVKDATGWQQPYEETGSSKTAPKFATAPAPGFNPALLPAAPAPAPSSQPTLDQQLQPLLEKLQALGPEEYSLEAWGTEAGLYRFRCEMPLGGQAGFTQQFESVGERPAVCIAEVTAEISEWKNARSQQRITPGRIAATRAMVR